MREAQSIDLTWFFAWNRNTGYSLPGSKIERRHFGELPTNITTFPHIAVSIDILTEFLILNLRYLTSRSWRDIENL